MNTKEARKIFNEAFPSDNAALLGDGETTCGCGWNGKVIPGAHGQRCPNCGEELE